jgi:hypothetical protein
MTLRRTARVVAITGLTIIIVAGCGSGTPTTAVSTTSTTIKGARPTTRAQLTIVAPTADQVVNGTTVAVKLVVTGAEILADHGGAHNDEIKPDEVHVHLSLDGRLVSMTFGDSDELKDLTPGSHTLTAELVASDHAPFANKVEATTTFSVV